MIKFDGLKLDPTALGSQGNAILGIRDSGKTYTATMLAEQLFDAGVPFVTFDPIGIWRFMRVPGKGRGYPIVVAGGQEGDLPLTIAGAPEIVRAAMANGVSLVIDLFNINLSKADWKRIVTACVRVLLHENHKHGLRHVFIEEAAEFAPQRIGPDQGVVYAEIEKLARMGGNSRLGYTLINQRAEEVNKAVLELCDNLFLHRQKGRNSLTALSKWLDIGNVVEHKEIIASLPTLPTGECWAWLQGSETPARVKVPAKSSFHPDRRVMRGDDKEVTKRAVDVGSFVATMRGTLQDIEQEATTLDELKAANARLQREIKAANKRAELAGVPEAEVQSRIRAAVAEARKQAPPPANNSREIQYALARIKDAAKALEEIPTGSQTGNGSVPVRAAPSRHAPRAVAARPAAAVASAAGHAGLPAGERAILIACAQHQPSGCTKEQLAILTGYKRSTRDAYIKRLRDRGLVAEEGAQVVATPDGIAALGSAFEPLPTGSALRTHWLERLPRGESMILRILCDTFPESMPRDELSVLTGFARSSRDAYLQRLQARQLVKSDRGTASAAPTLFD